VTVIQVGLARYPPPARYVGRITKRTNRVGGKIYEEEILPIDSLSEYFEYFEILEKG
jgi:hypothetical protein